MPKPWEKASSGNVVLGHSAQPCISVCHVVGLPWTNSFIIVRRSLLVLLIIHHTFSLCSRNILRGWKVSSPTSNPSTSPEKCPLPGHCNERPALELSPPFFFPSSFVSSTTGDRRGNKSKYYVGGPSSCTFAQRITVCNSMLGKL